MVLLLKHRVGVIDPLGTAAQIRQHNVRHAISIVTHVLRATTELSQVAPAAAIILILRLMDRTHTALQVYQTALLMDTQLLLPAQPKYGM